jgi:transcriptional regulator with XRE-family HTH domain
MLERSGKPTNKGQQYADGRSTPLPGLAAHRRRKALTQRQLGELAGVAHTTIQQLESGKRGGYPLTIRRLAITLGVEPEDLVQRS